MRKFLLTVGVALMGLASSVAQTVYFSEDFEWFKDFTVEGREIGDHVNKNDINGYVPQLITPKNADGTTLLDALRGKGYEFDRITTKTAGECIYMQTNYLKFGKQYYQGGIQLPSIDVPEGKEVTVSFDWCPMKGGTDKIDVVDIIVIVKNGTDSTTVQAPAHGWELGHALEWIHADVSLAGLTVNKDTQLKIRSKQWTGTGFARWMLDNIKVTENTASGIDAIGTDNDQEVVYYNLQGIRVNNPEKGIYIEKKGKKDCKKVVIM